MVRFKFNARGVLHVGEFENREHPRQIVSDAPIHAWSLPPCSSVLSMHVEHFDPPSASAPTKIETQHRGFLSLASPLLRRAEQPLYAGWQQRRSVLFVPSLTRATGKGAWQ